MSDNNADDLNAAIARAERAESERDAARAELVAANRGIRRLARENTELIIRFRKHFEQYEPARRLFESEKRLTRELARARAFARAWHRCAASWREACGGAEREVVRANEPHFELLESERALEQALRALVDAAEAYQRAGESGALAAFCAAFEAARAVLGNRQGMSGPALTPASV